MTTPKDLAELVDELRLIGCHANGDARCTCVIGQEAADLITAQAEENRRLREAILDAYHSLEDRGFSIEIGARRVLRAALSSTGEKG